MGIRTRAQVARILITIGIIGVTYASLLYILSLLHLSTAAAPHSDTSAQPQVSSEKPSAQAVAEYIVPPDSPKYIDIPAIGVTKTRVLSLGVSSNGDIATPTNTNDAGWYNASDKPGKPGAMFIFGHVGGANGKGVFYGLKKLKIGDVITITSGDNTIYSYEVRKSSTYPVEQIDMSTILSPTDATKPGLTLMTCDGTYVKTTGSFTNRWVVYASLRG